jgi:RNA polymerase sigma-70 factor (ECF subfamily)
MIFILITFTLENNQEFINLSDPKFFEQIYNEHKVKIYNFLIVKVNGDIHAAEEILSDTIYSALISAPKLKDTNKISGWLIQIANRRFYDYLRKKYRHKEIIEEKIKDKTEEIINEEHEENNKIVMLKTAMENLKPKYRAVIKLKFIDNKSQKEIAELLNTNRLTAESLIFRAKDALKKEVKKLYKEELA